MHMRNTSVRGNTDSSIVYSTESGRMCPTCSQPVAQCTCKANAAALPPTDGVVRVSLDTKGRKGKGVTVVKGVPLDAAALTQLGKQLKASCGSGGTVKDGVIEVQGDHRDTVIAALQKQGYTVKRAGG
jgi:translation initiation factor 1